ncbi:alpha/beta hydrolase family protein [Chitinophaga sp. LS1]|uniref:alpha/beta hydrolase family protein n=1 Tax=Chitinophaga sp. LS1 TaxID=3051176 RepID=UPI002AAABADC|nr:prolyl oligopeptidase family serine peptidase [Chitinophaga sp. LS1]WPV67819.1 prolyl oligopeptidase family serine peptidase [Chitinophaga sp. LS1]
MKKKNILLIFFSLLVFTKAYNQHLLPLIDTSSVRGWPTIVYGSCIVSNDGLYVGYIINDAMLAMSNKSRLIYKRIDNKWELHIDSLVGFPMFTDDNRYGICLVQGDQLFIQELGNNRREIIQNVAEFTLKGKGQQQYLLLRKKDSLNTLSIINLSKKSIQSYAYVKQFISSSQGNVISFIEENGNNYCIKVLQLGEERQLEIWRGKNMPSHLIIDSEGKHVSFFNNSSIWLWDDNSKESAKKIELSKSYDTMNLTIDGPQSFSPKCKFLFINIKGPSIKGQESRANAVQIFSYQDASFNLEATPTVAVYSFAYDLKMGTLIRLTDNHYERVRSLSIDENNIFISNIEGHPSEYYWNYKSWDRGHLLCISDRKKFTVDSRIGNIEMSPTGEYLVNQQDWGGDLYSINTTTRSSINITKDLSIPLVDDKVEQPSHQNSRGLEFYNWCSGNNYIIVYDRYDVWQIDLSGKTAAVNLTNGYGRKNHIVFRFYQQSSNEKLQPKYGQSLVITAFNEETKDNGFFRIKVGSKRNPQLLTMGKYVYCAPSQNVYYSMPIKAKDKEIWVVSRMSTRESSNYFWTSNFKDFHQISHIHPEKNYQWHTADLINFETRDGIKTQAILYKPDNFDSTKKYPVLFSYYEQESAKLNAFILPAVSDYYYYNFPMMLSHGYLICRTDIHFKPGELSRSIVNAVEGAGSYLAKLPYVDSTHYGLCGGSFGGYVTNCLATFSNKFAAAVPISAPSDLISGYGNVPGLRDEEFENRQFRMGVSLSTDPERYLHNSPVAYAKNVTTPILIVTTLKDYNVNVQQGIEWFISLRREGKPVWMLRYQQEGHGISNLNNIYDLYTRMTQFFDHYLKGAPAPLWMTKGIPGNKTIIDSGFEYDKEVNTPGASSLLPLKN